MKNDVDTSFFTPAICAEPNRLIAAANLIFAARASHYVLGMEENYEWCRYNGQMP